ncbi:MAG: ATP-binding protein [Thermoprotei archaeon]|nr:MAG: ATP-binding protein [Thermoprotei archaeon]
MLFDPRPKDRKSELFDREKELESLSRYASLGSPIILCLGIRRIGKTSVLKVFLGESEYPSIYIDARRLAEVGYSKQGFYRLLSEEFTRIGGRFTRVVEYLKSIKGVSVAGHGVEFNWRNREPSFSLILTKMDEYSRDHETTFIVAVDEAQYLRFLKGYRKIDFRQIMAYSYDNLRRVKFILAGSEMGLLYRFLGFSDPSSPLYGRVRDEVVIERFSREKSIEFLERGFSETSVSVSRNLLEKVVDTLDGIPGWLTYFGYRFLQQGRYNVIERILNEAVNTALNEIRKLDHYSPLYLHILRAIALGFDSWSSIKKAVEAWIGRPIQSRTLSRLLNNLVDMSIIGKANDIYVFLDPIYEKASKQL